MRLIKTVLNNGSKIFTLHVYLESEAGDSELSNYVLVDPNVEYQDATAHRTIQITPVINHVRYSLSGFSALLSFDDLVPSPSWVLVPGNENHADFGHIGGLSERGSLDRSGQILISTFGFAANAGNIGTLVLEVSKHYST